MTRVIKSLRGSFYHELTFCLPSGNSTPMLPISVASCKESRRRAAVAPSDWNDWRWQLRHRLTRVEELEEWVRLSDEERQGMRVAPGLFRVGTTPYYAELMDAERA